MRPEPNRTGGSMPDGNKTGDCIAIGSRDVHAERSGLPGNDGFGVEAPNIPESSESFFKAVFDHASIGIVRLSPEGRFLKANAAAAAFFGLTPTQILGKTEADLAHPDEPANVVTYLRDMSGADMPEYRIERRYLRSDGTMVWAELSLSALRDRTGKATSCIGILMDITERKRMEEAVRANEQLLRSIWRTSPVAVALAQDRRFIWTSQSWRRLFGFHREEDYVGRETSIGYSSNEEFLRVGEILYPGLEAEAVVETDAKFRRRDGSLFDGHLWATRLDPTDSSKGVLCAIVDVTGLRQAEAEVRRLNEELEQRVEHRTRELACANARLEHEIQRTAEARASLERAESLLRESQSIANVGGWEVDLVTHGFIWTDRTFVIHELEPGTPPSLEEAFRFFPDRDRIKLRHAIERARQTGESYDLELGFVTAKGNPRWVRTMGTCRFADGEPVRLVGTIQDITDRRDAEEALRESEQRYQLLVENTHEAVFIVQGGRFCFANRKAPEVLGWPMTEILSRPFTDFVHPDDRQTVANNHLKRIQGLDAPSGYSCRIKTSEGDVRWIEINSVKADWKGRPASLAFVKDVTEREVHLSTLEKQQALLQGINRVFGEALTCESDTDVARTCLDVAERLSGARFGFVGELNENGRMDAIALSSPDRHRCTVDTSDPANVFVNMEARGYWGMPLRDGTPCVVNDPQNHPLRSGMPDGHPEIACFLGVPLKRQGKITGMIGLANKPGGFTDDDADRLEALGMAFNEAVYSKRTELALADSVQRLERSNEELAQFTYVASHDLQEPLRKLTAFSELLKEDIGRDLPEDAAKDLDFIMDAAQRMQTLVQDLLALSRAGRTAINLERISLQECVDAAVQALTESIRETNAIVESDPLPVLSVDRTLTTQLFQNLIANAINYRTTDRPYIRITAVRNEDEWIIGVQDNGIGIAPAYLEQVFLPFKRLHPGSQYRGTGVGLSICKKVLDFMGGTIWAESEGEGKGSHFKFTLTTTDPRKAQGRAAV